MKKFEKLVRDKVPDIARAKGEMLSVRHYRREEFLLALLNKLVEEAKELRSTVKEARKKKKSPRTGTINELADLHEILDTLYVYLRISAIEVDQEQMQKYKEKGGFKKRLALQVF